MAKEPSPESRSDTDDTRANRKALIQQRDFTRAEAKDSEARRKEESDAAKEDRVAYVLQRDEERDRLLEKHEKELDEVDEASSQQTISKLREKLRKEEEKNNGLQGLLGEKYLGEAVKDLEVVDPATEDEAATAEAEPTTSQERPGFYQGVTAWEASSRAQDKMLDEQRAADGTELRTYPKEPSVKQNAEGDKPTSQATRAGSDTRQAESDTAQSASRKLVNRTSGFDKIQYCDECLDCLQSKSESARSKHIERHGKTSTSVTHLTKKEVKGLRDQRKRDEGADGGQIATGKPVVVNPTPTPESGRPKRDKTKKLKGMTAEASQASAARGTLPASRRGEKKKGGTSSAGPSTEDAATNATNAAAAAVSEDASTNDNALASRGGRKRKGAGDDGKATTKKPKASAKKSNGRLGSEDATNNTNVRPCVARRTP